MPVHPADVYPRGAETAPYALIDVRSPVEVARGALPGAHALPLMTDEERHLVGLRYAEAGQTAAIALGYELAGPHLAARAARWRAVAERGPTAVTCWRGGLRSALAVRHLGMPGVEAVEGGYRALRRHLVAGLAAAVSEKRVLVLGGLTGSGKTEVLAEVRGTPDLQVLDLEGLARHRGSAFGAEDDPQPAQATFENAVAAEAILDPAARLLVEDESHYVGRRTVPQPLWTAMRAASVIWLEAPRGKRLRRVFEGYVRAPAEAFGVKAAADRLAGDVRRVRKRLGGRRTDTVLAALDAAAVDWFDPEAHAAWIGILLDDYYDRLYLRAFEASGRRIAYRGEAGDVAAYLRGA